MEDFVQSLPVLYELPEAVSRDAIDAAVAHTREAAQACICRKANMGVVDQISDASQDFLKEVMMSIMNTPLGSRCSDCSKQDHLSKSSQESQLPHASRTQMPSYGSLFTSSSGANAPTAGSLFAPSSAANAPTAGSLFASSSRANAPTASSLFAPSSTANAPTASSLFTPSCLTYGPLAASLFTLRP
ncbi:hypothetical protein FMUND_5337 [Fusarium mundagurra]|uniref:Uncharacterized protein n=1 Tax=Fusarium mundagurra TaxID=1567541 RepID=A0A8H6DI14_9HYPO|nr:hypothetical protein FMUND_5337 [Fusarium mundagurra]